MFHSHRTILFTGSTFIRFTKLSSKFLNTFVNNVRLNPTFRVRAFYYSTEAGHIENNKRPSVDKDITRNKNSKIINAPEFITRRNTKFKGVTASTSDTDNDKGNNKSEERKMASLKKTDDKIIWVDCEMTGLDIDKDKLMEVACIVTDGDLKEIARHPSIIIHVADDVLGSMNDWCTKHHGESGLTYSCKNSSITDEQADEMLLNFVQKHTFPGVCPLAGNSNYMDRLFLSRQMPKFHKHLHYRNIDVSTIKEVVMRWFPEEYSNAPRKVFAHRVVSDIEESIAELSYYRSAVFREKDEDVSTDIVNQNNSVSVEKQ